MVKTIGVCYHCEHCEGETCPNRRIEEHYCDECGKKLDDDEIYIVDIDEVCEDCLKKIFRKQK